MIPEILTPPSLTPGILHIWKADLEAWTTRAELLAELLSEAELERLGRYKIPAKKTEFTLSRGLLRLVLGSYLGHDPASLDICINQQGKPYLPNQELRFNVSHSGKLLLCACSLHQSIGIDIQQIYAISSLETIAKRFFSFAEREYLAANQSPRDVFFEIWTAKEAYLKAVGAGFQGSPTDVSLLPDHNQTGRFRVSTPSVGKQNWSIYKLEVGKGFKAALAAEQEIREFQVIPLLPPETAVGKR
ncbi:MAG: 4'-phosphopantetheinyl transferase superfamily protein [Anaerolineales bacterium]